MSVRNGDKARYQKDRRRKMLHRQRLRAMLERQQAQGRVVVAPAVAVEPVPPVEDE